MFKLDRCNYESVSGLDNLRTRIAYRGGNREERMKSDKLKTLKKALFSSYQAATAVLSDGREFKCLINPNKLKVDYDEKYISIPFEDVCLNDVNYGKTSQGVQAIGMASGDVFQWKENGTFWIVYLQKLEETAYFRASCRKCQFEIDIEGVLYKVHIRGPIEQSVDWKQKQDIYWNSLNYTLVLTIQKNEQTEAFFHRFTKVKFKGKNWEVQAIDNMSVENIIEVYLKEDYSNSIEEEYLEEKDNQLPEIVPPLDDQAIMIEGPAEVKAFGTATYYAKNADGGVWLLSGDKARITAYTESSVTIEITTGRSGTINLVYRVKDKDDLVLPITITSL